MFFLLCRLWDDDVEDDDGEDDDGDNDDGDDVEDRIGEKTQMSNIQSI